jgi:ATP-dependent helicase HrpA
VFDVRSFETWWREASARTPRLLDMTEDDLRDEALRRARLPGRWQQGDQVLSLAYRFEPGAPEDGVSVVVPCRCWRAAPRRLRLAGAGAARRTLITALLLRCRRRSAGTWCPRPTGRRSATTCAAPVPKAPWSPRADAHAALARRIQRVANQPVTAADFELERVPAHLR